MKKLTDWIGHHWNAIFVVMVLLSFWTDRAHAGNSTINTTVPAANSALQSAPIRANFQAAATDINGLIGMNNGASAPASPVLGQLWMNTNATPYVLNVWDGVAWDPIGTLNSSANRWIVPVAQGGTGITSPGAVGNVLTSTGTGWASSTPTNTGTVTSVGLLLPSALYNVTGSPVTTSGTFAASLQTQAVNTVWAGPSSGGSTQPAFRALVPADIPTLNQNTTGTAANVTGTVAAANGGTGLTTCGINGYVLTWNTGSATWVCSPPTAGGTVTSVGLSLPLSVFSVSGSPVTGSGTITGSLNTEPANFVWAGPTTGAATAPAFRALVGADIPVPGASSLGGVFSSTAGANQFATGLNTLGALVYAQPSFANISGVAANAQIPAPTASALGGVESIAAVSHEWINTISTAGVPSLTQPAFTDLSGSEACGQTPAYTGDATKSAGSCTTAVTAIGGKSVTLGGSFSTSGAFGFTGTLTNTTAVTFPTSGTLATTANINTALPSTSSLYKGTGGAGVAQAATSGTDYAPATSGSAILKGNGAGGFSSATSGTDYAPATSGSAIQAGNGAGGFSGVTIGTGLSFAGGTLTNTQSASISTPSVTATTSNTTYTSNATPAAISALSQTLVASGTYQFEADLYVNGGSQGMAVEMNGTATATTFISQSTAISATGVNQAWTSGSGQNTALAAACSAGVGSAINFVRIVGTIVVNAGGTFTVYASQGASGATSTIIFTGSTLTLIRIS